MINPTELPDLDRLEALVREYSNTPTHSAKRSKRTVMAEIHELFARRAQPEGEAPQVEKWRHAANEWADTAYNGLQHLRNIEDGITEAKAARENMEKCCQHASAVAEAAATLSPLCGAQHAESGKEVRPHTIAELLRIYDVQDGDWCKIARAVEDRYLGAPGTPEAPKDERKGIELWRATLRACGELPEGYEVRIELENGCGMAVWYDAEGARHVIDGNGYLSDDVNEAVDAAIQRAAQLDGGQEGSE